MFSKMNKKKSIFQQKTVTMWKQTSKRLLWRSFMYKVVVWEMKIWFLSSWKNFLWWKQHTVEEKKNPETIQRNLGDLQGFFSCTFQRFKKRCQATLNEYSKMFDDTRKLLRGILEIWRTILNIYTNNSRESAEWF